MTLDLSTYTGLQAAIADYLNRTDLTTQIPGFIALTEAKIRRQVRRKTVRATFDAADEETDLPEDCAELRSIYPLTSAPWQDRPLTIGTPEMLAEIRARHAGVNGRPVGASVVEKTLVLAPCPDQVYTFQVSYYQALVPLSGSNASNAVLDEAPDIYLYGALVEASSFLQHDERSPMWQAAFLTAIDDLNNVRQREELNASYRPARLPVVY